MNIFDILQHNPESPYFIRNQESSAKEDIHIYKVEVNIC